jgi:aminopeptidase N
MSLTSKPQEVRLADYRAPQWCVDEVELDFELGFEFTEVRARLTLRRGDGVPADAEIALDGEQLELVEVRLDGAHLDASRYALDATSLRIPTAAAHASLETRVRIRPEANTALEGLYRSGEFLLTQCEAEGFRRITYFPDRPDVLARYRVTLHARRAHFPVLLSNGNPDGAGDHGDGRHWARWHDPHPKPSYLFALVAGRLEHIEDRFVTAEGRTVTLRIYAEANAIARCHHAMDCVKRAMRWDEQAYGRCYDLDVFHIVATNDFNMGAMENKGLNIFNAKYIVADPDTATDADFQHVESVVAHEYLHNWSGNRVTCRDWFQLSLKEGFTVFRDQQFSADVHSCAVRRIEAVRNLRGVQFSEDAGPFAHPVQPDRYRAINNFYTATVYEKGAEVVRLLHTALGPQAFRRGTDLYFARHDGQAITCEDFRAALSDASGVDLAEYASWYSQAGTPRLRVREFYDASSRCHVLELSQRTLPTPDQADKRPLPIPVRVMIYAPDGSALPLRLAGEPQAPVQRVLVLREATAVCRFEGMPAGAIASVLQDFSAPVLIERDLDSNQVAFLARHDLDPFNRWDAMQALAKSAVLAAYAHEDRSLAWTEALVATARELLEDQTLDAAFVAECLSLPDEATLAEDIAGCDPLRLYEAREQVSAVLAQRLVTQARHNYESLGRDDPHARDGTTMGRRRLKNLCLSWLVDCDEQAAAHAQKQFEDARNMTDRLGALTALLRAGAKPAQACAEAFYARYAHDPLVLDKWFEACVAYPRSADLARVHELLQHSAFSWRNPNKVRALLGSFARRNRAHFHAADGSGYALLGDAVATLDALNPQIAARMAGVFNGWARLDAARSALMRAQLERLAARPAVSNDLAEIVQRALGAA